MKCDDVASTLAHSVMFLLSALVLKGPARPSGNHLRLVVIFDAINS